MTAHPSLAGIVRGLGGDLYAGGRRASVPGPGHSRADRSVSLFLVDGRVIIHCFAGDHWRDVRDDLRDRGLVDRTGRPIGDGRAGGLPAPAPPSAARRRAVASQLWSEARPVAGTLSARHLALRGVTAPPQGLRHHPGVPAAVYAGRGVCRPALLAAISDALGELVGVEATYLASDGRRARMDLARKTIGLCPAGAAVHLADPAAEMLVGEGVFTTLSAAARFGLPGWALLSTRNLRAWRPPLEVRSVLIAADRGREGAAAARALADRLRRQGLAVAVRWPPAPYGDWNEALEGGTGEGVRRVWAGVADGWSGPPARSSRDDPQDDPRHWPGPDPR